jgi:hypothetical protein
VLNFSLNGFRDRILLGLEDNPIKSGPKRCFKKMSVPAVINTHIVFATKCARPYVH